MSAAQVVQVTVTIATAIPSRDGFGTILLLAYHEIPGPRVRTVISIDDAEEQGFTQGAYPHIWHKLSVMFSQIPRPSAIKVGRRDNAIEQALVLTPIAPQGEGAIWWVEIDGVRVEYEEESGDVVADIVTGLFTAINAASLGMTASDEVTHIELDADDPGAPHLVRVDLAVLTLVDNTANADVADDLAAVQGVDEDWYGLVLEYDAPAEVLAASAWVEPRTKLFGADVYTNTIPDPLVDTDVASVLSIAQRERTFLFWSEGRAGSSYAAGRMAGHFAEFDPGTATWAFKRIRGAEEYGPLPNPRQLALEAKRVNHLARLQLAAPHVALEGRVSSGQFIDVVRTADFIAARQAEIIRALLMSRPKIPYTPAGLSTVRSALRSFLLSLIPIDVIADDLLDEDNPTPRVFVPEPDQISADDRAARLLPDVQTVARLAGAVHRVEIQTLLQF